MERFIQLTGLGKQPPATTMFIKHPWNRDAYPFVFAGTTIQLLGGRREKADPGLPSIMDLPTEVLIQVVYFAAGTHIMEPRKREKDGCPNDYYAILGTCKLFYDLLLMQYRDEKTSLVFPLKWRSIYAWLRTRHWPNHKNEFAAEPLNAKVRLEPNRRWQNDKLIGVDIGDPTIEICPTCVNIRMDLHDWELQIYRWHNTPENPRQITAHYQNDHYEYTVDIHHRKGRYEVRLGLFDRSVILDGSENDMQNIQNDLDGVGYYEWWWKTPADCEDRNVYTMYKFATTKVQLPKDQGYWFEPPQPWETRTEPRILTFVDEMLRILPYLATTHWVRLDVRQNEPVKRSGKSKSKKGSKRRRVSASSCK